MEDYINKAKVWLSSMKNKESSYEKEGIRPKRDWEIILSGATFALFIMALVAGYFYTQVNKGNLFQVASGDTENEIKINKTLLDKTINDINDRQKSFDAAKQGSNIPPDPSL